MKIYERRTIYKYGIKMYSKTKLMECKTIPNSRKIYRGKLSAYIDYLTYDQLCSSPIYEEDILK